MPLFYWHLLRKLNSNHCFVDISLINHKCPSLSVCCACQISLIPTKVCIEQSLCMGVFIHERPVSIPYALSSLSQLCNLNSHLCNMELMTQISQGCWGAKSRLWGRKHSVERSQPPHTLLPLLEWVRHNDFTLFCYIYICYTGRQWVNSFLSLKMRCNMKI